MTPINLPEAFPASDYVPHGYLDNPFHSGVLNRSGVFRSVRPIGFGFWCRRMPWAYGDGARRTLNYLSLVQPGLRIGDAVFLTGEDFKLNGVALASRYHTKNALSYDWSHGGVQVRLLYFPIGEHTLACRVEVTNLGETSVPVGLHAGHLYGYNETRWWGSDGFVSRPAGATASAAKMWAYGDVFILESPGVHRATDSRDEWRGWIESDDYRAGNSVSTAAPDPVYTVRSCRRDLAAGERWQELITLTRGVNEPTAISASAAARGRATDVLRDLLAEDESFYEGAPLLEGDWPSAWKRGWIYDLETLRMCARPPAGIFGGRWDGMQIFSPRLVLGETVIDAMALSYAAPGLAKELILTAFTNSPAPNVPCCREDGSMNMISMGGEECGTAPIWVLPFLVIRSIFERDRDEAWLAELFPHLEAFVQWWLDNRRDTSGRFFCNNSWESGQDGSKRFLLGPGEEGKESEYVQTVDVEAAMANAMLTLAYLAPFAGAADRAAGWLELGRQVAETNRGMYRDGWFRDFDARTGAPIMLPTTRM